MNQHAKARIVVVDDERPILLTLEALLTRHHYEPHMAHTAAEGLATIRRVVPDLVLLDLGLPDRDGLEVLREVRHELPQTQVIILTANDSLAPVIEYVKADMVHMLNTLRYKN